MDIKKIYYDMLLIRRFEERAADLYQNNHIAGFCHLYIGQEAVVVGVKAASQPQDTVITSYRDHGHMLAYHMDPNRVMAELTGRAQGYSRGKGGSMHMFSKEKGFYGGHGIVGAQISLGTGLAFAHKYRQDGGVCAVYFGDGAANQGQFFESMNMAALWNLPVIYIIENNMYGIGTHYKRVSAGKKLVSRGEPFGLLTLEVDGMDVRAVYEVAQEARNVAATKGPVLIEVDTYRYRGHSMSDPATYRSKEEVDNIKKQRDPIDLFKKYILSEGLLTLEELDTMDREAKRIAKESANFAINASLPTEDELYKHVYACNLQGEGV